MYKRSLRRKHVQRLKNNRKNYNHIGDGSPAALRSIAITPCKCSCAMCGNPRKYFGQISKQEFKSYLNYTEGMNDAELYIRATPLVYKSV